MPLSISIPCIVFRQRPENPSQLFAIFSSSVADIQRWATIQRRHQVADGQQRRLSKAKINAITKFLRQDSRNNIAPALIIAIRPNKAVLDPPATDQNAKNNGFHTLQIELPANEECVYPGVVIDGQHRLLGLNGFNATAILPVVALLDAPDAEIAFQFIVINNKATRVASDLIRTLALDYQQHELTERLKKARVTLNSHLELVGILNSDSESPFFGIISLEEAGGDAASRYVLPAAIENAISVIENKNIPELADEDALLAFFMTLWQRIRNKWPDLWSVESKLMHKIGIVAMTSFISDALIHRYDYDGIDLTDSVVVGEETDVVLANQRREFWASDWRITLKDSASVRDKIVDSLVKVGRNERANVAWDQDLDLIAH